VIQDALDYEYGHRMEAAMAVHEAALEAVKFFEEFGYLPENWQEFEREFHDAGLLDPEGLPSRKAD
jgi:hypothetical protein